MQTGWIGEILPGSLGVPFSRDVESFRNGNFEDFCSTTVYEPENGTVKETMEKKTIK